MRFERHHLLSLEERLGGHLSAMDSDFDIGEGDVLCYDGLKAKVQTKRNSINGL